MDSTEDLLDLVKEFPQAFALEDGDQAGRMLQENLASQDDWCNQPKTQQLLELIDEFPDAFVDPCLAATPTGSLEAEVEGTPVPEPELASNSTQVKVAEGTPDVSSLPAGYAYALRQRVQTLTWGQIDFALVYGVEGLAEIWIVVGKSGTEIQSLCEAIARLINLLLLNQVPVPKILRQIRGIRGADSEGLGSQRILGLADLIGKVLQEAPAHWDTPWVALDTSILSDPEPGLTNRGVISQNFREESFPSRNSLSPTQNLVDLQENDSGLETHALQPVPATNFPFSNNEASLDEVLSSTAVGAALCPECGAELSQVNGCKGGACVVCGYSSCS